MKCKTEMPDWRATKYCTPCLAAQRQSKSTPAEREAKREASLRTAATREAKRVAERDARVAAREAKLADRRCAVCEQPVPLERNAAAKVCGEECYRVRQAQHARNYFYRNGGSPRGSEESARKLSAAKRKQWAESPPVFAPRKCRGCEREYQPSSGPQRYCDTDCKRNSRIAAKYGMSLVEFNAMLDLQSGVCALCGSTSRGFRTRPGLVVDHCHATGKVRGLLCGDCNTALGRFNDDPALLRRALDYLERE